MGGYKIPHENKDPQQDTGWSWLVAIAAFTAHLITHGIVYSFGILFITIQDTFNGTKTQLSWIPSLTTGSLYLIGPFASFLINRYGCRTVTIFGSILGFLGYVTSIFVRELFVLYITMGVVAGCGFGMVFLPSILIVTKHFNKYRSLACGFALSGAGGGAFVFSPLIEYLINIYGWKGTLLLLSAIILNCIPCALIYQSFSIRKNPSNTKTLTEISSDEQSPEEKCFLKTSDEKLRDNGRTTYCTECEALFGTCDHTRNLDKLRSDGDSNSKEMIHKHPIVIEIVHEDGVQGKLIETIYTSTECDELGHKCSELDDVKIVPKSICTRYTTLFKCTEVIVFFVSQFLFFAGFYLPFIYLPDKAKGHDIHEENAAWIASTIGISSITGRIVLGYLADRPFVNRMIMFKAALLITGISTAFIPVFNTLWLLLAYAVIYGISTGITLSLTSVVLVDIAGIDLLSDAMGLNNLFSAFGSLLGPPLAGLLYDITQSYTASFLASGVIMTVSGVMLILATFCRKNIVHLQ